MARDYIGRIQFSDPNPGNTVTLYRINGVVISSWPYTATSLIGSGRVEIEQNGDCYLEDFGTASNRPGPGTTWRVWTGTATALDNLGAESTPAGACNIDAQGIAPATNSVAPVISGTVIGAVVTSTQGTWANAVAYRNQWQLETAVAPGTYADISGETTLTLAAAPVADGRRLRLKAEAQDNNGDWSSPVYSNLLTLVYVAPTWSQQPSFGAQQYTEGDTVVINRGSAAPGVVYTVKTFTVNGVDEKANLVSTASGWTYVSATGQAGNMVLQLTATNSGGVLDSASVTVPLVAAPTGVPPSFNVSPTVQSQPIIGTPIDILPYDAAGTPTPTATFQWYNGNPSAGGASLGASYQTYAPTPLDTHFGQDWWLRTTLSNGIGANLVVDVRAGIVGKVFREDFAAIAAGGPKSDLISAGWTSVVDAQWGGGIVSEVQAPSGKALRWGNNSVTSGSGGVRRTDIATFLGANSFTYYEELILVRNNGVQSSGMRGGIRSSGTGTPTGPSSYGAGINMRDSRMAHVLPGEGNSSNSGVGVAPNGYGQNVAFWMRHRIEGPVSYMKIWLYGDAEPAPWTSSRVHTVAIVTRGPEPFVDYAPGVYAFILGFTVGVNTPAPTPTGVTLVQLTGLDPYDNFAAAAAPPASWRQFLSTNNPIGFDFGMTPVGSAGLVGYYVDGTPYILNPAGGAGVSGIGTFPAAYVNAGGWVQNGAWENPGAGEAPLKQRNHGYTTNPPGGAASSNNLIYQTSLNVQEPGDGPLSYAAGVEKSLVKSAGFASWTLGSLQPIISGKSVLTIVNTQPKARAFRPGVSAASKVAEWSTDDINWSVFPNLPVPPNVPNVDNLIRGMRYLQSHYFTSEDSAEVFRPYQNIAYWPYNARGQARAVGEAVMCCCLNIPMSLKRPLVIALLSQWPDIKARISEASPPPGNYGGQSSALPTTPDNANTIGGLYTSKKLITLLAAMALGDTTAISWCDPAQKIFAEDSIFKYIDATFVSNNAQYNSNDIGMPEWSVSNMLLNPYTAFPQTTTNYRSTNMNYKLIFACAIRALGPTAISLWNKNVILDYADRVMERDFFKNPADARGSVFQWARTIVDAQNGPGIFHISAYDMLKVQTPWTIWNWV